MKRLSLLLFLFYGVMTGMEAQKVELENFQINQYRADIFAFADLEGQRYRVKKNTENNFLSMSRLVQTNDNGTEGYEYQQVDDQPEVLAAFAQQINHYQKKEVPTKKKRHSIFFCFSKK